MTFIRRKLHSNMGASMPMALVFMMFSLAVAGVVLTAASANVGRTARIKHGQQDYFAVQSAARLMRDELQKLEFTGTKRSESRVYTPLSDGASKKEDDIPSFTGVMNEIRFKQVLEQDYIRLFKASDSFIEATHTLTLAYEGMPNVTAKLTLKKNYCVAVVLCQEENLSNPMTLEMPAAINENSFTDVKTSQDANFTTVTTVNTSTTTVTLAPAGIITKGGELLP
ncbi:MAG: hypothetical protein RSA00_02125 [Hydrogenoanaerobacterium sp.]